MFKNVSIEKVVTTLVNIILSQECTMSERNAHKSNSGGDRALILLRVNNYFHRENFELKNICVPYLHFEKSAIQSKQKNSNHTKIHNSLEKIYHNSKTIHFSKEMKRNDPNYFCRFLGGLFCIILT